MELKIKWIFQEMSQWVMLLRIKPSPDTSSNILLIYIHAMIFFFCHDCLLCICVFNYLETLFTKEASWGLVWCERKETSICRWLKLCTQPLEYQHYEFIKGESKIQRQISFVWAHNWNCSKFKPKFSWSQSS